MAVEKRPSLGGSGSWAATHPRLDYDNAYLYFGGYVQAMATATSRAQQRGCLRVAVLREPVARLVSAMLYCARARPKVAYRAEDGGDVLCGNRSSGSPEEWAAHWGRTCGASSPRTCPAALATCPRSDGRRAGEAVLAGGRAAGWRAGGRQAGGRRAGGRQAAGGRVRGPWMAQRAFRANDDGVSTAAGRRRCARPSTTQRRLRRRRIVEEWDDTMALFDALLPLSGGRRGAGRRRRHARLAPMGGRGALDARGCARERGVAQWLRADAQLYEAARARFGVLVRRHAHT